MKNSIYFRANILWNTGGCLDFPENSRILIVWTTFFMWFRQSFCKMIFFLKHTIYPSQCFRNGCAQWNSINKFFNKITSIDRFFLMVLFNWDWQDRRSSGRGGRGGEGDQGGPAPPQLFDYYFFSLLRIMKRNWRN